MNTIINIIIIILIFSFIYFILDYNHQFKKDENKSKHFSYTTTKYVNGSLFEKFIWKIYYSISVFSIGLGDIHPISITASIFTSIEGLLLFLIAMGTIKF